MAAGSTVVEIVRRFVIPWVELMKKAVDHLMGAEYWGRSLAIVLVQ